MQISAIAQVKNIKIDIDNDNVEISWAKSDEQVENYSIFRKPAQIDNWIQIENI